MACANGHAGIVHLLISAGAVRFVLMAEEVSTFRHVECMCTAGVHSVLQDVTLANAEGNVALHWACLNGHVEASSALSCHAGHM